MAIGKRLRFEILKRDGFTCRYCHATAFKERLEVDHVVPQSKGGTDDASNLVTAYRSCNAGKSNIPLEELSLPVPETAEAIRQHANSVSEMLCAQRELDAARTECVEYIAAIWYKHDTPMPEAMYVRLWSLLDMYPMQWLVDASYATGATDVYSSASAAKYFHGCLRNKRRDVWGSDE